MVPEISHRCPGCGVSIHEADVMFCPECGRALAGTDVEQSAAKGEQTGDAGEPAKSPVPPRVTWPSQDDQVKTASDEGKTKKPFTEDRHRARERTREKLQRASQMTRGAIEENVKRVEKMHHVSSVMLEEATYDPSLRFVLVALGLFVLFVILLVLSKVMG